MFDMHDMNNFRYDHDTDKEMLILKMVDVVGKDLGLIE